MTDDDDPRARWRRLPERVGPEEWVEETDVCGPDSTRAADDDAARREVQWLLERGGGLA